LDDADRIERTIAELRLEQYVRVIGFVSEGDLDSLYTGATALIFASQAEGFGIPLAEAMAAGLPVISVQSGTTDEVVGDAALVVDAGDELALAHAIARVLCEPELRDTLRRKGLNRAERYSPQVFERNLARLLEIAAQTAPK
jgi:glycosyltransferase involved in cell wall biosynthesis